MHQRVLFGIIVVLASGFCLIAAKAQPAPQPLPTTARAANASADDSSDSMLLNPERFTSEAAGIGFRPPAACKDMGTSDGQFVVSYSDDSRKWLLRVSQATFPTPVDLLTTKDKDQHQVQGLLDYTVGQLKDAVPGGEILRSDRVNVGEYWVGLIVMRYAQGGAIWLRQQAMVEANDQLYYVFNLVTPGSSTNPDDEKPAVETFNAMIDTVKLLDRSQIKADQDQRLYRTRALFLYRTKVKFASLVVPKQYFRILKNRKDVGYSFVEELLDQPNLVGIPNPGAISYERTRMMESDTNGTHRQTDAGIFQYMSYDRAFERWTRTVVLKLESAKAGQQETYATEIGVSSRETKRVFSKEIGVPDPKDPHAPPSREYEVHHLRVTFAGREDNPQPADMDLPPFYLPQAGWHFLPRLVVDKALRGARTYLFAVYVNEKRELMMLYVDVSDEQDLVFAGHQVHTITVTERLGLEGNPIVHYVTPDGKYLGSEDRKQHLVTLPSTEQELMSLWPSADLSRPKKAEPDNATPGSPQP